MKKGRLIGLAALPGAGKGELADALVSQGVEHVNLGRVVRQKAAEAGFVPKEETREAYLPFWLKYAQEHGEDWIARHALTIVRSTGRLVLLDGVRIPADAQTIVDNGTLFWMHAELSTLASRIIQRNRFDDQTLIGDPTALITALERDINDTGNFSMGTIRDLATVHLLPTPEISDSALRQDHYRKLAEHVLQIASAN